MSKYDRLQKTWGMTDWQFDCIRWQGKILKGNYAHWCHEWDGLPLDETCFEFIFCKCFDSNEEVEQFKRKLKDEYQKHQSTRN